MSGSGEDSLVEYRRRASKGRRCLPTSRRFSHQGGGPRRHPPIWSRRCTDSKIARGLKGRVRSVWHQGVSQFGVLQSCHWNTMSIFGIGKLCNWKDQEQPRRMRRWTSHLFVRSPRRRFAGDAPARRCPTLGGNARWCSERPILLRRRNRAISSSKPIPTDTFVCDFPRDPL